MTDKKILGSAKKIFPENPPVNGRSFSGKLSSVIVLLIILSVSLVL